MTASDLPEKAIARLLGIGVKTVGKHKYGLYEKLGVRTIVGATRTAVAHGVVTIAPIPNGYEIGPPLHAPVSYDSMFGRKPSRPIEVRA